MSYYSKWHLIHEDEAVKIHNPEGFFKWLEELMDTDFEGIRLFISFGTKEKIVEETARRKVLEIIHSFYGFDEHRINHFAPQDDKVVDFIGELSRFTDELVFLVEDEEWPTLEPGCIYLVKARDGKASAKAMRLVEAVA